MATHAKRKGSESSSAFTSEERAAMRERARETRRARAGDDGEAMVRAKIAEMSGVDRALAERVHALVREHAPHLEPKLWYGMPAYARDGKVVCFFQAAAKFKVRYATLGFSDAARLDEGDVWPVAFAVTKLSDVELARLADLVRRAAG